jgi:CubicO group peptidase (beta-lactamase class C family)
LSGLEAAFAAAHADDPGTAQLAVYRDGRLVADLGDDSIGIVMSCTKGVVAIAAHRVLDVDAYVCDYWPEFSARAVKVSHVLAHTAGLAGFVPADPFDWDRCVRALARMRPAWEPGTAVTYHSLSWGWLVGELIRRATGLSVGAYVARELAEPLGLDLWIGLPEALEPRVAPQLDDGFPIGRLLSTREARAAEIPAANAVTDARSLARLYAALLGEVGGVRLLTAETVERARAPRTDGLPLFGADDPHAPRFGLGFELPRPGNPMLGPSSFGHAGAGGRLAFADVESGLAVGYTCTAMRWRPEHGPDPRWPPLLEAIRREC